MKERPIIFGGPMVRAILDGRKTQTRRVVRQAQPPASFQASAVLGMFRCPYGVPGERLWVRETWCIAELQSKPPREVPIYKADGYKCPYRWRPSIHMPRAACRITLEVTEVRVQHLQGISEADAKAEGVEGEVPYSDDAPGAYQEGFKGGWDSINGKRAPWSSNPWVWAITFRRVA